MKVNVELTEKILDALDQDQLKEILKGLISPAPKVEIKLRANVQPILEEILKVREALLPLEECGKADVQPPTELVRVKPILKTREYFQNKKIVSDATILAIAERYKKGELLADILKGTELKYTTVYTRLQKIGIIKKKVK